MQNAPCWFYRMFVLAYTLAIYFMFYELLKLYPTRLGILVHGLRKSEYYLNRKRKSNGLCSVS